MGAVPSAASPHVPLMLAPAWGPPSPKSALRLTGAVPSACSAETLAPPHVPRAMSHRLRWLAWVLGLAAISAGCGGTIPATVPRPAQIVAFGQLYAANCSACHGAEGRGGAAIALDSPVYLAIADDAVVRQAIAQGVAGTPMPAFAQSAGGGRTRRPIGFCACLWRKIEGWSRLKSAAEACE